MPSGRSLEHRVLLLIAHRQLVSVDDLTSAGIADEQLAEAILQEVLERGSRPESIQREVLLRLVEQKAFSLDDLVDGRLIPGDLLGELFLESEKEDSAPTRLPSTSVGADPHRAPAEESATREPEDSGAFGRYTHLEYLGEGAVGRVYRATDPVLHRRVAIKQLKTGDPEMRERFMREARAQSRVDHPNVCRVYDVGQHGDTAYISMQLISGKSLFEAAPAMTLEEKVIILRDVALALHEANSQGVIHRDIKPANILLESKGGTAWFPFLVDFGLAREAKIDDVRLTQTGHIVGSPLYMSPEQAMSGSIDRRTDVYSLGVTMYEVLTGDLPFKGDTALDLFREVIDKDPLPPRKVKPSIPKDLETIVLKCMEKEPDKRYDSAKAVAEDLSRFLAGDPILAKPPSVAYKVSRKLSKHRRVAVTGAIAAVLFVSLFAVAVQQRIQAQRTAELAIRFAESATQMETKLRFAYIAPLHDIRWEEAQVVRQVEDLKAQISQIGAPAKGPGNYALGRAHIALQEYEKALEYLTAAWASGFRDTEVANSLGLTLGKLYQRELELAHRGTDTGMIQSRVAEIGEKYRVPALSYLNIARSHKTETPEYIRALIAFYEGNEEEALRLAKTAYQQAPLLYEARVLEGNILATRGRALKAKGLYQEARESLARAMEGYAAALSFARSDPEVYRSVCSARTVELRINRETGEGGCDDVFQKAQAACGKALQADAGHGELYDESANMYSAKATCDSYKGLDPRENLAAGLKDIERAIELNPERAESHILKADLEIGLGEYAHDHGLDPTEYYDTAVLSARKCLEIDPSCVNGYVWTSNAQWRKAYYILDMGGDPTAALQEGIAGYEKALETVNTPIINLNLGNVYQTLALYQYDHGSTQAVATLDRSLAAYNASLAVNPKDHIALSNSSMSHLYLGFLASEKGSDPSAHYERAIEHCRLALDTNPSDDFALAMIGITRAHMAEWRLSRGKDPAYDAELALQAFDESLEINADAATTYSNMALPYLTLAEYRRLSGKPATDLIRKARAILQQSLEINSDDFWTYVLLARCEMEAGLIVAGPSADEFFQRANQHLDRSLSINPGVDALRLKAELQLLVADTKTDPEILREAERHLNRALQIRPADSRALADLVKTCVASAVPDLAVCVQRADRALSANPNNPEALFLKGSFLLSRALQNRGGEAVRLKTEGTELLVKAKEYNPLVERKLAGIVR